MLAKLLALDTLRQSAALTSMIERFAKSVISHRSRWTVGVLALLLVAVWMSSRLSIRNQASDFLPRQSAVVDSTEVAVRALLGGADRVVVLLESALPIGADSIGPLIDSLAAGLRRVPGVRSVEYRVQPAFRAFLEREASVHLLALFDTLQLAGLRRRVSLPYLRQTLLAPQADSVRRSLAALFGHAPADPLGVLAPAIGLLERAAGGTRLRLTNGYYSLADQRGFLLLVEPEQALGDLARARALVNSIQLVLHRAERAGLTVTAVGRPLTFLRSVETTIADGTRVAVASAVVTFVLLLLFFRRLLAPFLLVGVVAYGLALTGALVHLFAGTVSVVVWLFVAVLVGLGDEFAFYIASHYWISGDPTVPPARALASALRRPLRGLVFSGLAMAAAFLSLAVVSYPVTIELAWITALGLLALMAAGFLVLPVGLAYTKPGRQLEGSTWRWLGPAHRSLSRHPRLGFLVWALLLGVSLWLAQSIRIELHPWRLALRNNPATVQMERARMRLGFWPSPVLMVSRGATPEAALARDRAAVAELDVLGLRGGIAVVQSLSRWLPPDSAQRASVAYVRAHAEDFSPARFRRDWLSVLSQRSRPDTALSGGYLTNVSRLLNPRPEALSLARLRALGLDSLVNRHLVRNGGEYLAVSYLYLERFPWAEGVMGRFQEAMGLGGPGLAGVRFIGDAVRGALHAEVLRRDAVRAAGLALLLVGTLLWVQFRRAMPALLCLVPLLCGIVAALGLMGLLGIELNVLTLATAPILIGLSVDDGIHMMERLEHGEPALAVLQDSGAAMVITTLTTVGGFACLGLATFPGVRELGLVVSVGILVALFASLHLLPLCYSGLSSRGRGYNSP